MEEGSIKGTSSSTNIGKKGEEVVECERIKRTYAMYELLWFRLVIYSRQHS